MCTAFRVPRPAGLAARSGRYAALCVLSDRPERMAPLAHKSAVATESKRRQYIRHSEPQLNNGKTSG